jgi:hypothetical protein
LNSGLEPLSLNSLSLSPPQTAKSLLFYYNILKRIFKNLFPYGFKKDSCPVAQVVEYLSSKWKVLSSHSGCVTHTTHKKRKKERRKEGRKEG